MSNLKSEGFVLNSIAISNKLDFKYQYDNESLDNEKNEHGFGCKEELHPEAVETFNDALKAYIQKLGFELKDWAVFEPNKIEVKGVLLKMNFTLTTKDGKEMSVTGYFVEGLGEIVGQVTEEARAYINGQKRKRGVKFDQMELFIGTRPKQDDDDEEPMDLPADGFIDRELEPEPAMA